MFSPSFHFASARKNERKLGNPAVRLFHPFADAASFVRIDAKQDCFLG
jgi:hypothetical protein